MCGIAGFFDFSNKSSKEHLVKMTDALLHRGPDGAGYFFEEYKSFQIGLGHRRLAIIDLSENGKQPMFFEDWVVVFNGEVYNFKEIRLELQQLGHQFQSNSDTEVILHSYVQWGKQCLDKFIGMFAFVLFNRESKKLLVARDRAGVKPLFIFQKENTMLFASELKAFYPHPKFEKEISAPAVYAFMQYGSVPTPHCIFENTVKLEPGHFIEVNLSESGIPALKSQPYWKVNDYYLKSKLDLGEAEAIKESKSILKSACEYRMVSDVPVGVFLSGGYDSSAVAAILQSERSSKLKTYTISVPDIGLNEAPYAKKTAELLGTDHTEIACTSEQAIELIDDLPFYYDEPFADSSAIPTSLVCREAKKEVTVALSADGGDEVFGGYNRYEMILRYGQKLNKIPRPLRLGAASVMSAIPPNALIGLRSKYNFSQRYEKVKMVLKNSSNQNVMLSLAELFTDSQMQKIAVHNFKKLKTYYDSEELNSLSTLSYAMAMDYQTYMLDDILQKVDRASMSASLESREPLIDHRLLEFLAQLPDGMKIKDGSKKYLLKEIVHEYIPKEEMDRPKMGFAIPIESWLLNELKDKVHYFISKEKIERQGYFKWEEIEKILHLFYKGRKEFGVKIWYILSFQMWYERNMV